MPKGVAATNGPAEISVSSATKHGIGGWAGGAMPGADAQNGHGPLRGCDGPSGAAGSGSITASIESLWQCSTGPSESSIRAEAENGSNAANAIANRAIRAVTIRRLMARIPVSSLNAL